MFNGKKDKNNDEVNDTCSKIDDNINLYENNSTTNVDQIKNNQIDENISKMDMNENEEIFKDNKCITNICDICEMNPIKGEKYECVTCNDPYNVCGNCYEFKDELHFPGHTFNCHINTEEIDVSKNNLNND